MGLGPFGRTTAQHATRMFEAVSPSDALFQAIWPVITAERDRLRRSDVLSELRQQVRAHLPAFHGAEALDLGPGGRVPQHYHMVENMTRLLREDQPRRRRASRFTRQTRMDSLRLLQQWDRVLQPLGMVHHFRHPEAAEHGGPTIATLESIGTASAMLRSTGTSSAVQAAPMWLSDLVHLDMNPSLRAREMRRLPLYTFPTVGSASNSDSASVSERVCCRVS